MNFYEKYIRKFSEKKILVIGDLMLDRFIYGTVDRISPEAPVPVVNVVKEIDLSGGAGNVANNISSLGAKVYILSVIGNDLVGSKLKSLLEERGINTEKILIDEERPTTIKTRIIAQHQQVVRVDKESRIKISSRLIEQIIESLNNFIPEMDAVLISDYGKGVIVPETLSTAIKIAIRNNIPITVDPKIEHFMLYRNVTCITPNLQEAISGMRLHKAVTEEEICDLGKKILHTLDCKSVIITRGEKGMSLFEKNRKPVHIPTRAKEVYDVTGAGDTVIAVLTLCLTTGANLKTSAEIANYAAGIVVGKLGTATVSVNELKDVLDGK